MIIKLQERLSTLFDTSNSKKVYKEGCLVLGDCMSNSERVNLTFGVYSRTSVDSDTGEITDVYSGGSLNQQPNIGYVGAALHKNTVGFEFCSSKLELLFCETLEALTASVNREAMDHLDFYVIFEVNNSGGKFLNCLKGSETEIVESFKGRTWQAFINTVMGFENYPVGVINEQKLYCKQNKKTQPFAQKAKTPATIHTLTGNSSSPQPINLELEEEKTIKEVASSSNSRYMSPPGTGSKKRATQPEIPDAKAKEALKTETKPNVVRRRKSASEIYATECEFLQNIEDASLFSKTA